MRETKRESHKKKALELLEKMERNTSEKQKSASSLITKDKEYYTTLKGNKIGVSTIDGSGKYGYSTVYIENNKSNRDKITSIKGEPEFDGKRYIWF